MPVDRIGQPEVLMCLSPIWTAKHETARRLAQRLKAVLDVWHGPRVSERWFGLSEQVLGDF